MQPLESAEPTDHPAARAWRNLYPASAEPSRVESLWHGKKPHNKSQIFALHGVGTDGGNIVAKRCPRDTAMIEWTVYDKVLPRVPVPSVRCHGLIDDVEPRSCWLFLEDAGRESYSPQIAEHRAIASRWLGMMHGATAKLVDGIGLPDRGADEYLRHLDGGRGRIMQNLDNPALSDDDRALLRNVSSQCDRLESRWDHIDEYCRRMPRTLVHADFAPKNLGTRAEPSGLTLLVFDWEMAGWGNPAPDLAECPDLLIYQSAAEEFWPDFNRHDVRRMATIGTVFRQLASLDWLSWRFAYPWIDKPVARLREWRDAFHDSTSRLGDEWADWVS
jgi:hypothetical protein